MSPRLGKPVLTRAKSTPNAVNRAPPAAAGRSSEPSPRKKVAQKTLINALLDLKQQQLRHERTIEKLFTTVQFLMDKLSEETSDQRETEGLKGTALTNALQMVMPPSPAVTPRSAAARWVGENVSFPDGTLIEL